MATAKPGDHSVFALYTGDGKVPGPPGGLSIGRSFRSDELSAIPESS